MDFLPEVPTCREDIRLLEDFAAATEAYFDAVKELQRAKDESAIFLAYEAADVARKECVAARESVERHRKTHGCRTLGMPRATASVAAKLGK